MSGTPAQGSEQGLPQSSFMWMPGKPTQVRILTQQTFYWLSHLPRLWKHHLKKKKDSYFGPRSLKQMVYLNLTFKMATSTMLIHWVQCLHNTSIFNSNFQRNHMQQSAGHKGQILGVHELPGCTDSWQSAKKCDEEGTVFSRNAVGIIVYSQVTNFLIPIIHSCKIDSNWLNKPKPVQKT